MPRAPLGSVHENHQRGVGKDWLALEHHRHGHIGAGKWQFWRRFSSTYPWPGSLLPTGHMARETTQSSTPPSRTNPESRPHYQPGTTAPLPTLASSTQQPTASLRTRAACYGYLSKIDPKITELLAP